VIEMPPEERGSKTFLPDGIFGPESEGSRLSEEAGKSLCKKMSGLEMKIFLEDRPAKDSNSPV
jgi:hypothetical protein